MELYYLAEASYVTTSGRFVGKTLRCFEVTITVNKYGNYLPTPTGVIYALKNNELVKGTSKAKLTTKWANNLVSSTVKTFSWGSWLFTTPELAILSKLQSIKTSYTAAVALQEKSMKTLQKTATCLPTCNAFLSNYPEYLL